MNREKFLELTKDYQHIFFDYGGIFINIEYGRTVEKLDQLSHGKAISLYSKHNQIEIFNQIETGKISKEDFIESLAQLLEIESTVDTIDEITARIESAWCAMLCEIRPQRVEFLKEVAKHKKVYLLSNINEIHEQFVSEYIQREFPDFYATFDKVYFSHKIGMRKPNRDIFKYVLEDNNIQASQAFFIDDSLQHIEMAKEMGINTFHLDEANSFICKWSYWLLSSRMTISIFINPQ